MSGRPCPGGERQSLPNIKMPNRDGFIPDPEFDPRWIGKEMKWQASQGR
jgi:hypothetical protein